MKLIEYFKGIGTELSHVVWPTRRQTIILTVIVVLLSVIAGYYLGLFDLIFSDVLNFII